MGSQAERSPADDHNEHPPMRRYALAVGLAALTGCALGFFGIGPIVDMVYPKHPASTTPNLEILLSIFLFIGAYEASYRLPLRMRWIGISFSIAVSFRYIIWRITHTLNLENPANSIASSLLLFAEAYALIVLLLSHFQTIAPLHRRTPRKLPDQDWPSVDVFITTYNEDVGLVRRTAVACAAINYPHKKVHILDDGDRPEILQLAQEVGVGYIARKNNIDAKAGNLNHALAKTHGQLIAQFDADHVPVASFLRETVPFFLHEPKLGFVQTPHHFYNLDAYQRNLLVKQTVANEQDLYFQIIQPGNNRWDSTQFNGSNAVFRRDALDDIGGFATETVTEDVHTSLRLHAKAWRSTYLGRTLSGGLAADTFGAVLSQRLRWGMGMASILRIDNPILKPGLKLTQRLCYLSSMIHFLYGFPRLIYFLTPLSLLMLNVMPVQADLPTILTYFLPHYAIAMLLISVVSRDIRHTFWSEVYESALAFPMAFSTVWSVLTPRRLPFKVTPKGTRTDRLRLNFPASLPQALLLILTLIASGIGAARLYMGDHMSGVVMMNLAWCVYNTIILAAATLVAIDRPQLRSETRVPCLIPVQVSWSHDGQYSQADAITADLSEKGAHLLTRAPLPVGVPIHVHLGAGQKSVMLKSEVIRFDGQPNASLYGAAIKFHNVDTPARHELIRIMYTDPDLWNQSETPDAGWVSFTKLAASTFRWMRYKERPMLRRACRFPTSRTAVLETGTNQVIVRLSDISRGGAQVQGEFPTLYAGLSGTLTLSLSQGNPLSLPCRIVRHSAKEIAIQFTPGTTEQQITDLLWDLYIKPLEGPRLASTLQANHR